MYYNIGCAVAENCIAMGRLKGWEIESRYNELYRDWGLAWLTVGFFVSQYTMVYCD